MTGQAEIVSLENLIPAKHPYREFVRLIDFNKIVTSVVFETPKSEAGADGYGKNRLIRCLILQFLEDLSDREMGRFIQENNAGKWFAGFAINEETPTYSTSKSRRRKSTSLTSRRGSAARAKTNFGTATKKQQLWIRKAA